MNNYIIGYDLNRPRGEDAYPNLIEAIKKLGTWWHCLDSTWIVKASKTAEEICDALNSHLDQNDELFVARLSGDAAWAGFDSKCSNWLKGNL